MHLEPSNADCGSVQTGVEVEKQSVPEKMNGSSQPGRERERQSPWGSGMEFDGQDGAVKRMHLPSARVDPDGQAGALVVRQTDPERIVEPGHWGRLLKRQ
jgi:hypothetical protein